MYPLEKEGRDDDSDEASAERREGLSLEHGTVVEVGAEATVEDQRGDEENEEALAEGEQAMEEEV